MGKETKTELTVLDAEGNAKAVELVSASRARTC
jgi:hypothetical protein